MVEGLSAGLDIRFGQVVRRVQYGGRVEGQDACAVWSEDAAGELTSLKSDVVLCTASLGVLKAG